MAAIARRVLGDQAAAEDVAQEVFLDLHRRFGDDPARQGGGVGASRRGAHGPQRDPRQPARAGAREERYRRRAERWRQDPQAAVEVPEQAGRYEPPWPDPGAGRRAGAALQRAELRGRRRRSGIGVNAVGTRLRRAEARCARRSAMHLSDGTLRRWLDEPVAVDPRRAATWRRAAAAAAGCTPATRRGAGDVRGSRPRRRRRRGTLRLALPEPAAHAPGPVGFAAAAAAGPWGARVLAAVAAVAAASVRSWSPAARRTSSACSSPRSSPPCPSPPRTSGRLPASQLWHGLRWPASLRSAPSRTPPRRAGRGSLASDLPPAGIAAAPAYAVVTEASCRSRSTRALARRPPPGLAVAARHARRPRREHAHADDPTGGGGFVRRRLRTAAARRRSCRQRLGLHRRRVAHPDRDVNGRDRAPARELSAVRARHPRGRGIGHSRHRQSGRRPCPCRSPSTWRAALGQLSTVRPGCSSGIRPARERRRLATQWCRGRVAGTLTADAVLGAARSPH